MQEREQCNHGVQGEGSGRTGMGGDQPEEGAPSLGPIHHDRQSHEVLLGAESLRAFEAVSPPLQGGVEEDEGTCGQGERG